jgi:membrane-associated phospholipid phosphatase
MILEGLRSTPSGHSALAFSGLHFVTVWMFIQFDVLCNQYHVWKMLICSTPEWLAIWIALSRTQDYRHHFGDILMGGLLGIAIAHLILYKMFKRKEAVYLQEPDSLPLYTTVD